jgi:histidine phosphotransferase ChpT
VSAKGTNAKVPAALPGLLAGSPGQAVDAHAIQPFYTGLLAKDCALAVALASEADAVVLTAS